MIDTKILAVSEELYNELVKEFPQLTGYVVSATGLGTESNIAYINTDDTVDESTLYDAIYRHDIAYKAKYDTTYKAKYGATYKAIFPMDELPNIGTEDNKMDNKIDELLNIVNTHRCKIEELYDDDAKAQIKRIRIKNKVWIELEKFADTYDKLMIEHNHAMADAKENLMNFLWDNVFYTDDERKKIDVIQKSTQIKLQTFRENMDTVERLIKAADTFAERYQILRSYGITDNICKCECQG